MTNTLKVLAFFVGFAVMFGGMFWLGRFAPGGGRESDARRETEESNDKTNNKTNAYGTNLTDPGKATK